MQKNGANRLSATPAAMQQYEMYQLLRLSARLPLGCLSLTGCNRTYTGTAKNPVKSGKAPFDFAGTGRSLPRSETRKLSSGGDNQLSLLAGSWAEKAVLRVHQPIVGGL